MRKISILILAIQFQAAIAQNFNPYYNFKHINVENGLAQDVVYHFLQDSRGYMWLGTRKGVTVFDGIRTIIFQHDDDIKNSLGGNFITRIVEDGDHQIWIGNNAGLDLFNPRENNFSHYSLPMADGSLENTYCVPLGLANNYDLWFIDTKSKLIRVFNTQTKKFRLSFPTDAVDGALYTDSLTGSIHVWSYLSNGSTHLVIKNDSLTSEQHFFSKENPLGNESLLIYHVLFENDTLAWLSTAKGLVALNPLTNQYKVYSNHGVEKIIEARYAMRAPGGLLWVSTGYGVYTFDSKKREYVDHFMNDRLDPYSLCSNNIVSLYFDRVGNIWCGSFGSGVSYAYVENNFFTKSLPKNELDHWKKGNNVLWLDADLDGNIWTILQDVHGFWLLDSSLRVKEYREPLLPDGKKFLASVYELLFDSKTTAWCLTDRGLFHYHIPSNTLQQV
ncbi:MAG TPA: two-component regulator propeller domain-containing protein, partial [Puia sp.]|nr:two-component regulator propeller domain-containing protein [Puia sp.]